MKKMSRNNRIAIIGASDLQLPLIERAKQMGFETHVFAWAAGDVGEKAADHFYPVSIVEVDRILEECRRIRPEAVVSIASDLAAITVNKVANALGLPANPPETALIATNKYEMREAFQRAGLPVPAFVKRGAEDDLSPVYDMNLPVIVKPTDRSGSRGIYKLTSFDSLREKVACACGESFEKKAIIEEYIEGEEYSCECISQNGIHHFLAITKKYTTGAPHFIETGHLEPAPLSSEMYERVKETVYKALDALHIKCGASHTEFKIDEKTGEIRLIETGARMGGDCIGSDLVRLSTGYDFVKMVIDTGLGRPIDWTKEPSEKAAAVRYIMNEKDLEHFEELSKGAADHIVRDSNIHFDGGRTVTDSSTRFGFYILKAETIEEACRLASLS